MKYITKQSDKHVSTGTIPRSIGQKMEPRIISNIYRHLIQIWQHFQIYVGKMNIQKHWKKYFSIWKNIVGFLLPQSLYQNKFWINQTFKHDK